MDDPHDRAYAREPQFSDLVRICAALNGYVVVRVADEVVVDLMARACGLDYAEACADTEARSDTSASLPKQNTELVQ